jgi:hypothetical protein
MAIAISQGHAFVLNGCSLNQGINTSKIRGALWNHISTTGMLPNEIIIDGIAHYKAVDVELDTLVIKPGCSRSVEYRTAKGDHYYKLRFKRPSGGNILLSDVESHYL